MDVSVGASVGTAVVSAVEARPSLARRATRSVTTTPGRLSVIAAALVLLTIVAGLFGALMLQTKQDTLDDLVEHREPLTAAAQQIYRSLSDADATAASAFLSGGVEPADLRSRYENDIAQAGAALGKASSDVAGDSLAEEQVSTLSQQLPVYTGLVETARANNRQGFPAGAAYLREASGLMRSKILPAAEKLYSIDFDRLKAGQADARSFPWFTALVLVALLVALVITQVYLTRRTNRLINVGLLVASIAVGIVLVWGTVALLIASAQVADGERNGSDQVDVLVQARINSLKCRADETLTLVARGDGGGYEKEWKELAGTFTGDGDLLDRAQSLAASPTLAAELRDAGANADAWVAAHRKIRELDDSGQYEGAVAMAIGTDPQSAAAAFAKLDKNMISALYQGREEFFGQTNHARAALTGIVPGVAALAVLAAIGITVGVRERLREYR